MAYNPMSGNTPDAKPAPVVVTPSSIAAARATVGAKELAASRAETAAVRAADPLTNKSVKPNAPANTTAVWVGGTNTGGWKFQTNAVPIQQTLGGGADNSLAVAQQAANAAAAAQAALDRADAFANLKTTFESYGLGSLSDTITRLMTQGETATGALTRLKYDKTVDPTTGKAWNDAYTTRFAGNQARIAAGLNAISESSYIGLEDSYAQTLKAYGLGNMISTDRTANEAKFATYIGNDLSATEFNDRIKVASDNVINADPQVMATFKQYYGGLTNSDLVSYFLAPDETLPILQQKTAAAQIGTASYEQGLGTTDAARAAYLAKMGVNQAGGVSAISGYQNVADVLPAGQKLSSIYQAAGINYNKTTAENEYLLQNADATQQRKRLASLERAQFSGDAGINPLAGNLASARTVQGKF